MRLLRSSILLTLSVMAFNTEAGTIRSQLEGWAAKAKSAALEVKEAASEKVLELQEKYEKTNTKQKEPSGAYSFDVKAVSKGDGNAFIDYGFFSVNYSCEHRGFNYINYTTVKDQGEFPRYKPFHKEDALNNVANCENQKTTGTYKSRPGQALYHRGHGVHQNIWDHDERMMFMTNAMTNIVPHNGTQNISGLWRGLEERVECARDKTEVEVYLGNDWGSDASNDHFVNSHGVTTPDRLWRVHVYKSHPDIAFAWLIPNDEVAKKSNEEKYKISLESLKKHLSDDFLWPMPSVWVSAGGKSDPYKNTRCSLK